MIRQSVLLLPSHVLAWRTITGLLREHPQTCKLEVVTSRSAVRARAAALHPDLVVLPAAIDGCSTIELVRAVRLLDSPESRVAVIARDIDDVDFAELGHLGVAGLLVWRDIGDDNVQAYVDAMLAGATIHSPRVDRVLRELQSGRVCLLGEPFQLTPREQVILRQLFAGLSRQEIGEAEGVSDRTIKRDIEHIMAKLDAHHQFVLGARAALLGFVP